MKLDKVRQLTFF